MNARTLLIALFLTAPLSLHALDFGFSLTASPSPAYNGSWDPAFGGASAAIDARFPVSFLTARAGIECGVEGIGVQLLVPVGIEYPVLKRGNFSLSVGASLLPGLALFRPLPLFMWGAELGTGASWYLSAHWGLEARLGLRYLTCPEYSARVARNEVVNVPASVGIRYRL